MILRKLVLGASFLSLVSAQSCSNEEIGTAAAVVAVGAAMAHRYSSPHVQYNPLLEQLQLKVF
jgi:hypothetical protein